MYCMIGDRPQHLQWTSWGQQIWLVDRLSIFDLLPQLKEEEWLNCWPGCFVSYHYLPVFWCPYVFLPLIFFFKFYPKKGYSNGQQIWLVDRLSRFLDHLPLLKDEEWLNCWPGCFVSYHNLPEFWYPNAELPLIQCSSVLSVEMLLEKTTDCWPFQL